MEKRMENIQVQTEHLRKMAKSLKNLKSILGDIERGLDNELHRLDLLGNTRREVDSQWIQARGRGRSLQKRAAELAAFLEKTASDFDRADQKRAVQSYSILSRMASGEILGVHFKKREKSRTVTAALSQMKPKGRPNLPIVEKSQDGKPLIKTTQLDPLKVITEETTYTTVKKDINHDGKLEKITEKVVVRKTVAQQIVSVGCLMTCWTMLLRDKGEDVYVTDIYEANYNRQCNANIKPGDLPRSFGDAFRDVNGDGAIDNVLKKESMNLDSGAINDVAPEYKTENGSFALQGETDEEKLQSLKEQLKTAIDDHGPVIVHVNGKYDSGHWIVVDQYNETDGTFEVRDPATGQTTNADFDGVGNGARKAGKYKFYSKVDGSGNLSYRYLTDSDEKAK
ncbi:MAG: C39 family peptidase [Candidatus Saccharibacteria bacterium]